MPAVIYAVKISNPGKISALTKGVDIQAIFVRGTIVLQSIDPGRTEVKGFASPDHFGHSPLIDKKSADLVAVK
jgi:hypothetical protein